MDAMLTPTVLKASLVQMHALVPATLAGRLEVFLRRVSLAALLSTVAQTSMRASLETVMMITLILATAPFPIPSYAHVLLGLLEQQLLPIRQVQNLAVAQILMNAIFMAVKSTALQTLMPYVLPTKPFRMSVLVHAIQGTMELLP